MEPCQSVENYFNNRLHNRHQQQGFTAYNSSLSAPIDSVSDFLKSNSIWFNRKQTFNRLIFNR